MKLGTSPPDHLRIDHDIKNIKVFVLRFRLYSSFFSKLFLTGKSFFFRKSQPRFLVGPSPRRWWVRHLCWAILLVEIDRYARYSSNHAAANSSCLGQPNGWWVATCNDYLQVNFHTFLLFKNWSSITIKYRCFMSIHQPLSAWESNFFAARSLFFWQSCHDFSEFRLNLLHHLSKINELNKNLEWNIICRVWSENVVMTFFLFCGVSCFRGGLWSDRLKLFWDWHLSLWA